MTEISWQAVELRDGSTVQRGSASFAAGVAQATATLVTRVNTTRAIAFASVQAGGQSMGRTSVRRRTTCLGVASATAALSPTQLTLDRNSTLATADVGWFVVQFAGGDGFKVGSFTKAPGVAPTSQTIAHGLGEVPKALILWTQGAIRRDVQQRIGHHVPRRVDGNCRDRRVDAHASTFRRARRPTTG